MIAGAAVALGYALMMRLRGMKLDGATKIPFGPFLAVAIWIAWLLG
jgi:prepilin signal peptidase PulO-like enzyme (type II secretory pathway)